jgi:NADH-dependent peroxiredoxin subunit F
MLDETLRSELKNYLVHLKGPIELRAMLDTSAAAADLKGLLDDIAAASPLISILKDTEEGVRVPSFGIARPGESARVRFAGLPLGHEFSSLVLALLHVSGHPPKVDADVLERARSLGGSYHFETYFSASCQNCPEVVQSLNTLAAQNQSVSHVAIDGALFQAEVEGRQVLAVPTVYVNGQRLGQGRMDLEAILNLVDQSGHSRKVDELSKKETFDVLIVGAGPAGAAAAIYAARKGIRTGMLADRLGGQVLDTLAIENFISVLHTEGPKLAADLLAHVLEYPVDVIKNERVKAVRGGDLVTIELESGAQLTARTLLVATGARWRDMNVPGEREYRTRGVTYCPHCDGPLFKGKRVAVIGGGNSGVEAAIDLAGVVRHVTVLEFAERLKADAVLERKLRSLPNVEIVTQARTTEVVGDERKVTGLNYEDRKTGATVALEVEGIFVQIGLLPNTDFLQGVVELNRFGEIVVGPKGQTSSPNIFAAGDATTVPFKQIIIAAGDGAKAALGAFEHLMLREPVSA